MHNCFQPDWRLIENTPWSTRADRQGGRESQKSQKLIFFQGVKLVRRWSKVLSKDSNFISNLCSLCTFPTTLLFPSRELCETEPFQVEDFPSQNRFLRPKETFFLINGSGQHLLSRLIDFLQKQASFSWQMGRRRRKEKPGPVEGELISLSKEDIL